MTKLKKKFLVSILVSSYIATAAFWPSAAYALDSNSAPSAVDIVKVFQGKFGPDMEGASTRIAGTDRYLTTVKISQAGWSNGSSPYAILSAGMDDNLVDALTAAPLAYQKKAPILLTEGDALTPETKDELARLDVHTVYVTSGVGVIKQPVLDTLQKDLKLQVVKLGGKDRFETAINIAKEMGGGFSTIALSTAYSNADALSMASIAAAQGIPIFLSDVNQIPSNLQDYLKTFNIQKSYVLGGEGVLSKAVEAALPNPTRLGGVNRYETNYKIIDAFSNHLKNDKVYLASGNDANIVDALAGSSLAAKTSSPMVLIDQTGLDKSTENLVKDKMFPVFRKNLIALGGEQVVPQAMVDDLGTVVQYLNDGATEGAMTQTLDVNHSMAVIANDVKLMNVETPYDVYVQGNNTSLKNVSVGQALVINPGTDGNVSLENVNAGMVFILSGSNQDGITIKNSKIGMLIIDSINDTRVSANFDSQITYTSALTNSTLEAKTYPTDLNVGPGFGRIIVGTDPFSPEVKFQGDFTKYKDSIAIIGGTIINMNNTLKIPSVIAIPMSENSNVTLKGLFGNVIVQKPCNFSLLGTTSSIDQLVVRTYANENLEGHVGEEIYGNP